MFSHDSHNLIVIGDNDRDMYLAVQELCAPREDTRWWRTEKFTIPAASGYGSDGGCRV